MLIDGIVGRLAGAKVLIATAGRPHGGPRSVVRPSHLVMLEPLDAVAVRGLLASLGIFRSESILDAVVVPLHRASKGSPLLVLEALQFAIDMGVIRRELHGYVVDDPQALLRGLEAPHALEARLGGLDQEACWLLLVMATAGAPLAFAELQAASSDGTATERTLLELEAKAFVVRHGEAWAPLHDEIASAALHRESPERRRAAHVAVAKLTMSSCRGSSARAIRAARHFAVGEDEDGLRIAFRHGVLLSRAVGDRRSDLELARQVTAGDEGQAKRLVRGLPLRFRLGLHSRTRVSAAAALVLMAAAFLITILLRPALTLADGELVLLRTTRGSPPAVEEASIPLRRQEWPGGVPMPLAAFAGPLSDSLLRRIVWPSVVADPQGERWAFPVTTDNANTSDVAVWHDGGAMRVFPARRDDIPLGWTPDGNRLVISTARWSPLGDDDYDIAIGDPSDASTLHQLTATRDHDVAAAVAPHGGLLAFSRRPRGLRPNEVCWVTLDGAREACAPSPIGEVDRVVGWLDQGRVLVTLRLDGRTQLARWTPATAEFDLLFRGTAKPPLAVSPDGAWVVCRCVVTDGEPEVFGVFPVNDPGAFRPLVDSNIQGVMWRSKRAFHRAKLRVSLPGGQMFIGPSRLPRVVLVDASGARIAIPQHAVRWGTTTPEVVGVDSSGGRLVGHRAGVGQVIALLEGVEPDTVSMLVTEEKSQSVFTEDWSTLDAQRWLAFGEPRPALVRKSGHRKWLTNGGDASYTSGLMSAAWYPVHGGFGVESEVVLPITRAYGQQQSIGLVSRRMFHYDAWDRRTGSPSMNLAAEAEQCAMVYPGREGFTGLSQVVLIAGGEEHHVEVDSSWRTGRRHHMLLQVFPDGTCGFAIDAVPVWRSTRRVPLDVPYRLVLEGKSEGTQLLVGTVRAWSGARGEAYWRALEEAPMVEDSAAGWRTASGPPIIRAP